ncbi:isocitrate lyase/PEP mutase family protein [Paractinoplanes atraurantiacus]|uniref:Methylisocitrate lyase n=1 Tax=Paractinoplanes atraurantiacus TaxID=1036182 RepID=A0A285K5M7_9ACTN|nr:isocitrate lyase/PEP mutase family protein [Actinoplanes atraurantiacus]SNY66796.1 methylisocitrate lyase [Actinoplanes atraurantiacus]
MTAAALRALLAADRVTHAPGVHDPLTAALLVRAGHRAAHLSGAAVSALTLGRPDLGFMHGTHIAAVAATIVPALGDIPVLADADTGYGNPLHAVWTALAYARAGISGLHVEDQVQPKRCGHLAGKELVPAELAAAKIRAVAKEVPSIALVARTDAYGVTGLEETIARCAAYADAGADAVFPEGVVRGDDLLRLRDALPGVPLIVNRSEAGKAIALSDSDLTELGVRLVLHPVSALLAGLHAAAAAYRAIASDGGADPVQRLPWAEFTALTGQDEALALDSLYAPGRPS